VPEGRDAGSLERDVDRLYGLPLDEFTSARNALARELKSSGDSASATRVQKLAKPTRSAGAINRAVRQNRREAKRLLSAADKLRKAQERLLRDRGRRPVDQAAEGERGAVDRLMAAVEAELQREGKPSESMLERARNTLHAVATTPELREEFEAGRMTKDHRAIGFGALSAAPGTAAAKPRRSTEKSDARRRLKRAEQELEAAERRLQRAESEKREAEGQLAAANAAVARSEQAVVEAAGERDEAREALDRT
jgi:chromosome segregation ATPase